MPRRRRACGRSARRVRQRALRGRGSRALPRATRSCVRRPRPRRRRRQRRILRSISPRGRSRWQGGCSRSFGGALALLVEAAHARDLAARIETARRTPVRCRSTGDAFDPAPFATGPSCTSTAPSGSSARWCASCDRTARSCASRSTGIRRSCTREIADVTRRTPFHASCDRHIDGWTGRRLVPWLRAAGLDGVECLPIVDVDDGSGGQPWRNYLKDVAEVLRSRAVRSPRTRRRPGGTPST